MLFYVKKISATFHRGVGPRPYGPEAAFSAVGWTVMIALIFTQKKQSNTSVNIIVFRQGIGGRSNLVILDNQIRK